MSICNINKFFSLKVAEQSGIRNFFLVYGCLPRKWSPCRNVSLPPRLHTHAYIHTFPFKLTNFIPLTTRADCRMRWRCVALKEETNHERGIDRHLYKKESTAGGIDRLPCSRICSSLVSLYYKLGIQKVPPRALVPRIRSSRCIYRRAITIRSNVVSESLTIPFVFERDIHRRSVRLFHKRSRRINSVRSKFRASKF